FSRTRSRIAPSAGITLGTDEPWCQKGRDPGLLHRLPNGAFRCQRHFDGENAAFAGHIADTDHATVGPYSLPRDCESWARPRPVGASSVAEHLKQIGIAVWNPTTLGFCCDE